ncbi:GntR family transcriptional regulator [Nonomuraea sediminis]|uniref:GntR family transcriptional regulator n=1 Tax=Nonomuraea sediminis TaxID=2835864 RepID=UPI001BDD47AA|nr:GntR family transcriptional regulator [Nonomuraea sediminis]
MIPIARVSLGERVAHSLRLLIIGGELASGTHLVEEALAERFGVSRGPIRDALRVLEAEGLLESRRRGVYVTGLTDADVDELYSLRESMESLAVRLAMRRASDGDWAEAAEALASMRRAAERRDVDAFSQADLEFHSAFYRLSGHRRLGAVWEQYRPTFAVILDVTNARDRELLPAAAAHADLLTLARSGDEDAAVTALSAHLLGARHRLRQALHR